MTARIVSYIDIDSIDAFRPCQRDPDPDPAWPSSRRQHDNAAVRVIVDEGSAFSEPGVYRLCRSCASEASRTVLRCSGCGRAPVGYDYANGAKVGTPCRMAGCEGEFAALLLDR